MTRFVKILTRDRVTGERLRLEQLEGLNIAVLALEHVSTEQVENPDACHFSTYDMFDLSIDHLRWLHQVTGELLSTLELAEADHVEGIPGPVDMANLKPGDRVCFATDDAKAFEDSWEVMSVADGRVHLAGPGCCESMTSALVGELVPFAVDAKFDKGGDCE